MAMTPGKFARRLLGPLSPVVGNLYRAIFVSAERFALAFPEVGRLLDVGGGDGYLIDRVLRRQPHLRVTMTDLSSTVGASLTDSVRDRVRLLPATSAAEAGTDHDAVLLADVLHHVPVPARVDLLKEVAPILARPGARLIVKDVEPGSPRATLSYLADVYISGDRGVHLISKAETRALVEEAVPGLRAEEIAMNDEPNYLLVFTRADAVR